MGRLAKLGIARGRKVPVEGLLGVEARPSLDEFTRQCMGCFGFARIADKVLIGSELNVEEIEMLLRRASIPVLLKLVELRGVARAKTRVMPTAVLALESWLDFLEPDAAGRRAIEYLRSFDARELNVVCLIEDFGSLELYWPGLLRQIKSGREGLKLVGPGVESVTGWLARNETAPSRTLRRCRIDQLLGQLKLAGFDALLPAASRSGAKLTADAGFVPALETPLERFREPALLAREIFKIARLVEGGLLLDSWSPVLGPAAGVRRSAAANLRVVRALAVGSICMPGIARRGAEGRCLSLEAIEFARQVGGNGLIYGAVDDAAAERLNLYSVAELEKCCRLSAS